VPLNSSASAFLLPFLPSVCTDVFHCTRSFFKSDMGLLFAVVMTAVELEVCSAFRLSEIQALSY
jgi:hypothetical protein